MQKTDSEMSEQGDECKPEKPSIPLQLNVVLRNATTIRQAQCTLVQILAMRCYASNGVVHARSIYRFKARRIHVTHSLCDAERPDKAPHGLMLKFNVRGNRPESNKLGSVDQQVTMPDHL